MHYNEAITNQEGLTMLAYPSRRSTRFIPAKKIMANPDFYRLWALRSARRLSTYSGHWDTSYLFEQLAQVRGFAYAVQLMGVQQ